jgi:broad specificity phosphatase PhoE
VSSPARPVFNFVFLRHGESIGNVESRWQGQADYPLTERGRAQVRSLAERWKSEDVKFDLAVTSTLIRARETAEIVASTLDVKVEYDPIWMERHVGEMAGLTAE